MRARTACYDAVDRSRIGCTTAWVTRLARRCTDVRNATVGWEGTMFELRWKFSIGVWCLSAVACGVGSEPESADRTGSDVAPGGSALGDEDEGEMHVIDAGAASAALGLERWELKGADFYGVAGDGTVLAKFRIRTDEGAIESILPEQSVRRLDGSAEFSVRSEVFYAALERDMASFSEGEEPLVLKSGPTLLLGCFPTLATCQSVASQSGLPCTCGGGCLSPLVGLHCTFP